MARPATLDRSLPDPDGTPSLGKNPLRARALARPVAALLLALTGAVAVGAPGTVRNADPQMPARARAKWPINVPGERGTAAHAGVSTPPTAEQLLARMTAFHSALRYEESLAVTDELVASSAGHPLAHYNRACLLARLRRVDEALDALDTAVQRGWRDLAYVSVDPDLASLRARPRYRTIVDDLIERRRAERIEPVALRRDSGADRLRALADTVPPLLDRYRVPGVVVAVVHDGRLAGVRAFGAIDRGGRTPMPLDTPFRVRAPGHLIALVAASRLHEQAALDLPEILAETGHRDPPALTPEAGTTRRGPPRPGRDGGGVTTLGALRSDPLSAWPAHAETDDARRLLRLAVATGGEDDFGVVCRTHVLRPLGMTATRIGGDATPRAVCAGHTRLGTVIPVSAVPHGPAVTDTTARDLARLIAALTPAAPEPLLAPASMTRLVEAAELDLRRLGFAVHADRTAFGTRVQAADVHGGVGCLLRWYPAEGSGVVVLFNGEDGNEAALRIAHAVLGGV